MDFVKNGYENKNALTSMYISTGKPSKRREIRGKTLSFVKIYFWEQRRGYFEEIIQSDLGAKPRSVNIGNTQINMLEGIVAQVCTSSFDGIKFVAYNSCWKTESKKSLKKSFKP